MEDRVITLQKEIVEEMWHLRAILYSQISEIEKKIKKLEKMAKTN